MHDIAAQARRIHEQPLAQIAVDRRLAFRLRQSAEGDQIIALDTPEIIFGLGVHRAEYRIAIGLSVDVRDAPLVSHDAHRAGFPLPAGAFVHGALGRARIARRQHRREAGEEKSRHRADDFIRRTVASNASLARLMWLPRSAGIPAAALPDGVGEFAVLACQLARLALDFRGALHHP